MPASLLTPNIERRAARSNAPLLDSPRLNVRPVEAIYSHAAPNPVAQGSETPARPARMPIFTSLNLWPWEQEDFNIELWANVKRADTLHGQQITTGPRVNIMRTPAAAYGSLFSLQS